MCRVALKTKMTIPFDKNSVSFSRLNSSPKNEILKTGYSDLDAGVNGDSHIAP
jgi:hypothetical protein